MKLDPDDLESDARGTPVGLCSADHRACMPPHSCAATTLALIARIRELEDELSGWRDEVANDRTIKEDPARLTTILEKGAVLR